MQIKEAQRDIMFGGLKENIDRKVAMNRFFQLDFYGNIASVYRCNM
jgi:hypothetical protein